MESGGDILFFFCTAHENRRFLNEIENILFKKLSFFFNIAPFELVIYKLNFGNTFAKQKIHYQSS
jgi:hypothetical protein